MPDPDRVPGRPACAAPRRGARGAARRRRLRLTQASGRPRVGGPLPGSRPTGPSDLAAVRGVPRVDQDLPRVGERHVSVQLEQRDHAPRVIGHVGVAAGVRVQRDRPPAVEQARAAGLRRVPEHDPPDPVCHEPVEHAGLPPRVEELGADVQVRVGRDAQVVETCPLREAAVDEQHVPPADRVRQRSEPGEDAGCRPVQVQERSPPGARVELTQPPRGQRRRAAVEQPRLDVVAGARREPDQEVLVVAARQLHGATRPRGLALEPAQQLHDPAALQPAVHVVAAAHEGGPGRCDPVQRVVHEPRLAQRRLQAARDAVRVREGPDGPVVGDARQPPLARRVDCEDGAPEGPRTRHTRRRSVHVPMRSP